MLELRAVTAGYADTSVLREVEVRVPPSSVVALLGPNGAGKTTLLRVAAGLLRLQVGAVTLDGRDITDLAPHRRAALGLCHVPERRGVFPSLTVREHLALFRKAAGDEAVERALVAFPRLGERLGQRAGTMSGGEQQMLALARAYLQRPRVVLLDEVSMGLAPRIIEDIFVALRRLAADGASLLIVEQYVHLALEFADHAYILNRGQITFTGQPAELASDEVFEHYVGAVSS